MMGKSGHKGQVCMLVEVLRMNAIPNVLSSARILFWGFSDLTDSLIALSTMVSLSAICTWLLE